MKPKNSQSKLNPNLANGQLLDETKIKLKQSLSKSQTPSQVELQKRASQLILTLSTKIIAVDISYRDSGVCLLKNEHGLVTIYDAFSIQNPAMDFGFESLRRMSGNIKSTIDRIRLECSKFNPDVVLLEMPFFTQNAKAAISIGLVWSAVSDFDCILVEPSFIKLWSGSEAGDKK